MSSATARTYSPSSTSRNLSFSVISCISQLFSIMYLKTSSGNSEPWSRSTGVPRFSHATIIAVHLYCVDCVTPVTPVCHTQLLVRLVGRGSMPAPVPQLPNHLVRCLVLLTYCSFRSLDRVSMFSLPMWVSCMFSVRVLVNEEIAFRGDCFDLAGRLASAKVRG